MKDILSECYEYLLKSERSSTEVEKSIACLRIKAAELQAQTELAEKYFTQQMSERERLFNSASQVLDKAMCTGDIELVGIAIKILEVVRQKPPFSF